MQTELIYMHDMQQLECESQIINIIRNEDDNNYIITLDRTVFYPQGGGQPYDIGTIAFNCSGSTYNNLIFQVEKVYFENRIVQHIGTFSNIKDNNGSFTLQSLNTQSLMELDVICKVDGARRKLNTRNHSAGHLIDMAMRELGIDWTPGKGYHYPEGAYVEYAIPMNNFISNNDHQINSSVNILNNIPSLLSKIESKANEIISRRITTTISFTKNESDKDNSNTVTTTINGKPMRLVHYGDYAVPCGGTHVANLSDIGHITIRKIKKDKDNVKVSYSLIPQAISCY